MKKLGIGIVGLGFGGNLFTINREKNILFEVRGICSIDPPEKLKEIAESNGIAHYTTDFKDLLAKSDIDIIAVYTPDKFHRELCEAALKAGKHIICTKPITSSLADAKALVKIVEETGLKFLVGQTMRFEPQFETLKKLYDDGDLGKIIMAEAHYLHDMRLIYPLTPWRLTMPQDFIYGGLSHPVDSLRWFLGDVEEVHAYGNKAFLTPNRDSEFDNYLVNLKFQNGAIARAMSAFDLVDPPKPLMEIDIYGTKGTAVAEYTDMKPGILRLKLDKLPSEPPAVIEFPAEAGGGLDRGLGKTVMRYIRHFEECFTNDIEPNPGVRDGAKTIAVCDAAYRSMKEGRAVKVDYDF